MTKLFFCAALCFVANFAGAQADQGDYNSRSAEFLSAFFADSAKPVLVAAALDEYTLLQMKAALEPDTFFRRVSHDNWKTVSVDTFVIAVGERHVIDSSLNDMPNFAWTGSPLPGATVINQQSVDSIKALGPTTRSYLTAHYHTQNFYWLSKPILFRNNTICIFYCERYDGGPSTGRLGIFARQNNKWVRQRNISTADDGN